MKKPQFDKNHMPIPDRFTPEGWLKHDVKRLLKAWGWFVETNVQGELTRGKAKGRPDLEASKEGITIRIETKAPAHYTGTRFYPEGTLSEDQVRYIKDLTDHKIIVVVTADYEDFVKDLTEVEHRLWPEKARSTMFYAARGS